MRGAICVTALGCVAVACLKVDGQILAVCVGGVCTVVAYVLGRKTS